MLNKTKYLTLKENTVTFSGYTIRYRLMAKESKKLASYRLALYSNFIDMIDQDGKQAHNEAIDLFSDINKAIEFYLKLVEGVATPTELSYIIEDEFCIE